MFLTDIVNFEKDENSCIVHNAYKIYESEDIILLVISCITKYFIIEGYSDNTVYLGVNEESLYYTNSEDITSVTLKVPETFQIWSVDSDTTNVFVTFIKKKGTEAL